MSADQKTFTPREVVEIELKVVLEEYKTLREEILANINASRQMLNLTLTGTGIILAVSRLFVESQLPILFLVVSLVFYAMAWAQLRYMLLVQDIGEYLRDNVESRIRKILAEIAPTTDRDFGKLLGWSSRGGGILKHHKNVFVLPIAAANYGIPILAAASSAVAYILVILRSGETIVGLDRFLLALNGLALVYSVAWGFRVEFKK